MKEIKKIETIGIKAKLDDGKDCTAMFNVWFEGGEPVAAFQGLEIPGFDTIKSHEKADELINIEECANMACELLGEPPSPESYLDDAVDLWIDQKKEERG